MFALGKPMPVREARGSVSAEESEAIVGRVPTAVATVVFGGVTCFTC